MPLALLPPSLNAHAHAHTHTQEAKRKKDEEEAGARQSVVQPVPSTTKKWSLEEDSDEEEGNYGDGEADEYVCVCAFVRVRGFVVFR